MQPLPIALGDAGLGPLAADVDPPGWNPTSLVERTARPAGCPSGGGSGHPRIWPACSDLGNGDGRGQLGPAPVRGRADKAFWRVASGGPCGGRLSLMRVGPGIARGRNRRGADRRASSTPRSTASDLGMRRPASTSDSRASRRISSPARTSARSRAAASLLGRSAACFRARRTIVSRCWGDCTRASPAADDLGPLPVIGGELHQERVDRCRRPPCDQDRFPPWPLPTRCSPWFPPPGPLPPASPASPAPLHGT